jgi:lipopolysaccharide transport system ATP-binding protein
MSTVIKIENLYKEYRLGVIGHGTLYRDIQSWWAKVKGEEDPNTLIGQIAKGKMQNQLLALNNINLEVKEGEVLGIIGSNGAGKSTLLKILSRVTAPTKGLVKIRGKIASLLEVGTGFHMELTGRENIYLNGAINGMNRKEVSDKLEEIVDFSGVAQFLDTPVKRYSSGMHVRLGFSVAAHLNPNILVVDEVLSVGDAAFQKKAIGKMKDVSKEEGRTVLFVSHNLQSINDLCQNAVLMDKGSIILQGDSNHVVSKYLSGVNTESVKKLLTAKDFRRDKQVDGSVIFTNFELCNEYGELRQHFNVGEKVCIHFSINVLKAINCLDIEMGLVSNKTGELLVFANNCLSNKPLAVGFNNNYILELETSSISCGRFPMHLLLHGKRMYEDYDFLSKSNLPPLHIINPDYSGSRNDNAHFAVESKIIIKSNQE